jgi:glycosyltransferase involved in cell wall biosynthesis
VLDGIAGRLVDPGDERSLAGAMDEVISDPARARSMGAAGRSHAEDRFGARAASERYASLYRAIVSNPS